MNTDTPASPQDLAAVRRAALAHQDHVRHIVAALAQRAGRANIALRYSAVIVHEFTAADEDMMLSAAAELRALIEPVSES